MTGSDPDHAPSAAQLLTEACGYPWGPAPGSCVFSGGELLKMVRWDGDDPGATRVLAGDAEVALGDLPGSRAGSLRDRRGVVAYGSNASLNALTRKFGAGELIPILAARLTGVDVVYSAHIAAYGAIPATLQGSPGTSVPAWVMWLSAGQLGTLHASEPNYHLAADGAFSVDLDGGGQVTGPGVYVSRHGALRLGGDAAALEAIPARGRALPARGQREVLDAVRRRLGFAGSLEAFVAENVADPRLAARRTAQLRADAVPFAAA